MMDKKSNKGKEETLRRMLGSAICKATLGAGDTGDRAVVGSIQRPGRPREHSHRGAGGDPQTNNQDLLPRDFLLR